VPCDENGDGIETPDCSEVQEILDDLGVCHNKHSWENFKAACYGCETGIQRCSSENSIFNRGSVEGIVFVSFPRHCFRLRNYWIVVEKGGYVVTFFIGILFLELLRTPDGIQEFFQ